MKKGQSQQKLLAVKALIIFCLLFALVLNDPLASQTKNKTNKKPKKKTEKVTKTKKATQTKLEETATPGPAKTTSSNKVKTNILDPDDDSMSGTLEWNVVIKDDNGNVELPDRFRTWWYIRLDGVNTKSQTTLNVLGDGFPGKSVVLPVYSYDRINWHRFCPEDIIASSSKDGSNDYTIQKQFDSSSTIWIARYYPYPLSRLNKFLKALEGNPLVKVEKIGESAQGRPINMITITDPKTDINKKKRVWVHSRTHPSETGSSFLIEGLVNLLISDCNAHCKDVDLSKLVFHIVPMVNPDGVAMGNARVTPYNSLDLERTWFRSENNYNLKPNCPPETKALHSAITKLEKQGPEFIIALNIHSKNAYPGWNNFLYTNFSKEKEEYGEQGINLFKKQLHFAQIMSSFYCGDTADVRISEECDKAIEKKLFPEMWWWLNFRDKVMAATIETTSGYDGCFEEWVTYKDQEYLGKAIAKACNQYYKYYVSGEYFRYERPEENMDNLIKYYRGYGK
jgi:hypothetical protein